MSLHDNQTNIAYCAPVFSYSSSYKTRAIGYDKVVDANEGTKELYEENVKPIIDAALLGFNGTVFVYGQARSGKKFTMRGCKYRNIPGIIELSANKIFDYIYSQSKAEYTIKVSAYEMYQEKIKDLSVQKSPELKTHEIIKCGKILENHQSPSEIIEYYDEC